MKAFVKNLVAGTALAFASIAAHAEITPPAVVFDEDGSGGFSATIAKNISSFSGVWDFFVPTASQAAGSVTSTRISAGVKDLVLTSFYITGAAGRIDGNPTMTGATEQWVIDAFNIAAGNYKLFVTGNVVAKNGTYGGGSFGGQLDLAAPVPEPATWGMMIGGLAMVALYVRRRKASNDGASFNGAMLAA